MGAKLGGRIAVSRDEDVIFLYADDEAPAREVALMVQAQLGHPAAGTVVLTRWHPVEQIWEDADVPLPTTPEEIEAERDRQQDREAAESAASGHAEWEVRVELPDHDATVEFADQLEAEGFEVTRRFTFLLIGAANEDEANELAERLESEAPEGATIEVEPSGQMVWSVSARQPVRHLRRTGDLTGTTPGRRARFGRPRILRPLSERDFALLDRDDRLAARRRDLPRRGRLADVRALERAHRAVDRRRRLDAAARPLRPRRRRSLGPLRPPADHDRLGRDPGARDRAIGVLSLTGSLELWNLVLLVAVYGAGEALFVPSFQAIVPDLVPAPCSCRRTRWTCSSAARGGARRARARRSPRGGARAGTAFLRRRRDVPRLGCVPARDPRAPPARRTEEETTMFADLREGYRFVRSIRWLWMTLSPRRSRCSSSSGPAAGAASVRGQERAGRRLGRFGLALAAAGVGSIVAAIVMGGRSLPRRFMTVMYVGWMFAIGMIAFWGLATGLWQIMLASFCAGLGSRCRWSSGRR